MNNQHVETLVVGAGQAGLATAYHLRRLGRKVLIVDANARVGDNWRQQWDSLRLYSPANLDGLPGMRFPADPHSFPSKDQVADFLEEYARRFELPVRLRVRVERLEARGDAGYVATLSDGKVVTCDNVVVATGSFGRSPSVPAFAAQLSPSVLQLHSSQYRRPSQLANGPVLVVGASHSGCDIAFEVSEHLPTTLCGRDPGEIPLRWESRLIHVAMPVIALLWHHVLTRRTPIGRKAMGHVRRHGAPMLRVKRRDLAKRGVRRTEARMTGVSEGMPRLADGTVLEVANVIWCTGFRQAFDWIKLPIFDDDGWPREYRGVVPEAPGLFFCGLSFQFAFSSMVFLGVGRDAEHVARRIAARTRRQTSDARQAAA